MSDASNDAKIRRGRSPAYPNIGLPNAVQKARQIYEKARKHSVPVNTACGYLGLAPGGGAYRYIAALLSFGLLDEDGAKDDRHVKLSQIGLAVCQLPEGDLERIAALQAAALGPKIYREILEKWNDDLPPDEIIARYLIRERGYNDEIVMDLIHDFRETYIFAGLGNSNSLTALSISDKNSSDVGEDKFSPQVETRRINSFSTDVSQGQIPVNHIALPIPVARGRIATLYMPSDISRKEYERIKQYLDFHIDTMFEESDGSWSE